MFYEIAVERNISKINRKISEIDDFNVETVISTSF